MVARTTSSALLGALLLTGCAGFGQPPVTPDKPAKPYLPSLTVTVDGGITLDGRDTERLMKYIIELERRYE